jgi:hypothetical protein
VGNLVKAAKVSQGMGAEFMGFFQPTIYAKPRKTREEQEVLAKLDGFLAEHRAGNAELHTAEMRKLVQQELAAAGGAAQSTDLSGVFDDTPSWIFEDFIHVRREGNQKIAAAIYAHLVADPKIRAALDAKTPPPPTDEQP